MNDAPATPKIQGEVECLLAARAQPPQAPLDLALAAPPAYEQIRLDYIAENKTYYPVCIK